MDNYLDIANSAGMWVACSVIIVVVLLQAIRLTIISLRSGKAMVWGYPPRRGPCQAGGVGPIPAARERRPVSWWIFSFPEGWASADRP